MPNLFRTHQNASTFTESHPPEQMCPRPATHLNSKMQKIGSPWTTSRRLRHSHAQNHARIDPEGLQGLERLFLTFAFSRVHVICFRSRFQSGCRAEGALPSHLKKQDSSLARQPQGLIGQPSSMSWYHQSLARQEPCREKQLWQRMSDRAARAQSKA